MLCPIDRRFNNGVRIRPYCYRCRRLAYRRAVDSAGNLGVCGIAGIFHLNGAQASGDHLRAMTRAIAHRGPDGEGHWVESSIALGHRRLSIIDLSDAGAQPMQTEDGRYIMTYNGEL